jgi:Tfp pilus assembly protein PilF
MSAATEHKRGLRESKLFPATTPSNDATGCQRLPPPGIRTTHNDSRMFIRLTALVLLGCFGTTSAALASDRSQVLSSRGLIELEAAHYEKALELFDEAVAADPSNIHARYYRAAARARLSDYDGSILDLEAVLAAQPDFNEAALDLGVGLIEKKQYRKALPWLEQAQRDSSLEGKASLFLGLAQLRLGLLEKARENFDRAAVDSEQNLAARYYKGVVDYREGNWSEATGHFAYVAQVSPDSAVGREADAFLVKIRGTRGRRYQVYGATGFEYDSNLDLGPDNGGPGNTIPNSGLDDGRATLAFGGVYVPWSDDAGAVSIGYDFYQSLHFNHSSFDLQDHGPSLQLTRNFGPFQLGVLARYDYYLLQTQSFLQQTSTLPWVTIPIGDIGRTQILYRMRWRDYKKMDLNILDGVNHAVGLQQYFYLGSPDRYVSIGYEYDHQNPDNYGNPDTQAQADAFQYDGNEFNVGIGWLLPAGVSAQLSYEYRHERYASESELFNSAGRGDDPTQPGKRRQDNEHNVMLAFRRRVWENLSVTAAYLGNFNNSDDPLFEYDRNIASLTLDVTY